MLDFQQKLQQLATFLDQPALAQRWPDTSVTLSLVDALKAAGENRQADLLEHALSVAQAESEMLLKPIIGVLGELNSGKSSVVASFLSEQGKARLPRGEDNEHGTHRFVYWVPSKWMQDSSIKSGFLDLLERAHGHHREFLSLDPQQSAKQYRSGIDDFEKIAIPLIADDPALDALDAAFLDCPDAQTRDRLSDEDDTQHDRLANPRLEFIGKSSLICSAFLLVWERGKLRDRMLETFLENIRGRLSKAPLYLLVNKIRPEQGQPTRTRGDSDLEQLIQRFRIDACYGAFDFDIFARGDQPGWQELTPVPLVKLGNDSRSPQFFQLESSAEANLPEQVEAERFLQNLPAQLNPAELQQAKQQDHWSELARLTSESIVCVDHWIASRNERAATVHRGLLKLCTQRFTDPVTHEPLQILSREYAEAFAESFVRTAPIWARVILKGTKPFDKGMKWCGRQVQGLTSKLRNLKLRDYLLPDMSQSAERIKDSLRKTDEAKATEKQFEELGVAGVQLTDAKSLSQQMHGQRWVSEKITEACLEQAWTQVVANAHRYRLKYDDQDEQFDQETSEFWNSANAWQKTKLVGSSLLKTLGAVAAIGGVAVAAIDGGATLFVTYSFGTTLSAALPGLSALGVAALGGAGALAGVHLSAVHQNTLPNLSRYFALACDAFGVPRQLHDTSIRVSFGREPKKSEFRLPEPKIPQQDVVCSLDDLRLWSKLSSTDKIEQLFREVKK
jgi:hypothetical protein